METINVTKIETFVIWRLDEINLTELEQKKDVTKLITSNISSGY